MKIDIVTLFPNMFDGPLQESMIRLAQKKKLVNIEVHNLRKWTHDAHKTCDDKPFGGGPGMVMKIEPIDECLKEIQKKGRVIMLSPRGKLYSQSMAKRFAKQKHLIFLCGHYEGIDERVHKHLVDEEVSIGDFVTTGGELPVLCVVDSVVRLLPGVLGNQNSLELESFEKNLLEYPQYTRPSEYKGWEVPDVLRSGKHSEIKKWRETEAIKMTKRHRPDLLKS